MRVPEPTKPTEIEVALEPPAPVPPKVEPKPKKDPPPPKPKAQPKRERIKEPAKLEPKHSRPVRVAAVRRPQPVRVARNTVTPMPATTREKVNKPVPTPRRDPGAMPGAAKALENERPIPNALPGRMKGPEAPKFGRMARAELSAAPGGSEAPGEVLGGHGGAAGPEAPPEDIMYAGSGAGGANLPHVAPRIGGGGGRTIISVENPLAKELISEDAPGLGPGRGGGIGAGNGGGVGFGKGRGIGTRLNGKVDIGTLASKVGSGIGAGSGSGIGTHSPGGGTGTGSELPGTGGSGRGYGRGIGNGIRGHAPGAKIRDVDNPLATTVTPNETPGVGGLFKGGQGGRDPFPGGGGRPGNGYGIGGPGKGTGTGRGLGTAGTGRGAAGPESPGSNGGRPAAPTVVTRAPSKIAHLGSDPSVAAADMLRPAPPRGTVFGARPNPGKNFDVLHVVYLLDVSDSMNQANKEGRARAALKKALSELERKDTFNVIMFDANIRPFSSDLVKPSPERIAAANQFMESQETHFGTNLGAALKTALSMNGVTHVYLITDGEPTEGIKDGAKLRRFVIESNESGAQIVSICLATSPKNKGIDLLKGLAEDSGGSLHIVHINAK